MKEVENLIKKDNLIVPNNIMIIKKLEEKKKIKSNDLNGSSLPEGWVERIDKKTGKSQWSKRTGDTLFV
jgi:hypothetical protein